MNPIVTKVRQLWVEAGSQQYEGYKEYSEPNRTYLLAELDDGTAQIEFDWGTPKRVVTNEGSYNVGSFGQTTGNTDKFFQLLDETFTHTTFRPFRRFPREDESGPALRIRFK